MAQLGFVAARKSDTFSILQDPTEFWDHSFEHLFFVTVIHADRRRTIQSLLL